MRPYFLLALFAAAAFAGDSPQFTPDGQLMFPKDYREWVFVTSGLGMTYGTPDPARAQEPRFDNVFVNRAAWRAFQDTGKWPDQTVFILEVRSSESKSSINNGGHFQSDIAAVEAEVKTAGKWAFYGFGKGAATARRMPATAACYSCHAQHGAVDNTFVQFYPTLQAIARERGTFRQEH